MSRWTKMSKEELLEVIRKEIIAIGIDDYPSQTRYTEKSRRETSPSATAARTRLDMTWKEIVDTLGFHYSEKKHELFKERASRKRAKRTSPSPLKGKKTGPIGSKWTRMKRVDLAKRIKKAIRENNIETVNDYREFRLKKKEDYPSYTFIYYYFGNLKDLKNKDVRRW
ncbi:MAG: hypothetical protein ACLTPR_01035 [Enterococcus canintestini]|uniref:hypothetical protein n=1 Tax=Enterococcus canintestini TaxID=317010 RepID=UPI003991A02F